MRQAAAERGFSDAAASPAQTALRPAHAAVLLAVTLLALWAWGRGLSGPYHFDDYVTPLNDPASQSLTAWWSHLPVTLRPVTKASYALEAEAGFDEHPAPRRVVSIALLLASAALLALLAARLAPLPDRPTTAVVAGIIAVLWLAHPVHADNVLLISGRTAVLSGLFLLAALLALEQSRPWLAGALFLIACLARETALAGLLPLLILAASRPGSTWRFTVRELLPCLLAAVLAGAWILSTPRYLMLAEFSFLGRPFWSSVAAQVGAVPVGLGLLFRPTALSIDYGLPLPHRPSDPLFLVGLALYATVIVCMLFTIRRSRPLAVGLALSVAALLPTQSLIPKLDPLTNRPLGLALAGLLLAATPMVVALSHQRNERTLRRAYTAVPSSLVVLCTVLAVLTAQRASLFQSELTLWQDAARKSHTNERPHLQYAQLLEEAGRHREARAVVAFARGIAPFSSEVELYFRAYNPIEVPK